MRITLNGAAREVTGSCYYLESKKTRILVDCGIFQGSSFASSRNFEEFDFDSKKLDAVILTHAHLDHTGRLPVLIKKGFKGRIYATPPTIKLTELILTDAENIMDEDFRHYSKPKLYELDDVKKTIARMHAIDDSGALCLKDLEIQFYNAGHIFGSAFIRIRESGGAGVTFSGDLGNTSTPILKPKDALCETDILFIESTYGNRIHEDENTRGTILKEVIVKTIRQKGVLLIPAFAIERTQELLYELNHLTENRLIPYVDIFMDSPMAGEASKIFNSFPKYYSKKAYNLIASGDKLFDFPGLTITHTRDESKSINTSNWPKVIIAGSGMMNGGRILHHLVRYLSNKKTTLLIIGYQAHGTIGRKLYKGERKLSILNELIDVNAKIVCIGGYSAHADQHMLTDWISSAKILPQLICCTHGETDAATALATHIKERFHVNTQVPRFGETIDTAKITN